MTSIGFFNLIIVDDVLERKRIWHFREEVKDLNRAEDLFEFFSN